MSFSSEVKTELCRAGLNRRCCALAEAYGVLLYANVFTLGQVRIMTENDAFAARLPRLFRRAFDLEFDVMPALDAAGKRSFLVTDPDKLRALFTAFGYDTDKTVSHHINLAVVESECDRVSFLRGAFRRQRHGPPPELSSGTSHGPRERMPGDPRAALRDGL